MTYSDLNERQIDAIDLYRKQMEQGFIIEDKYGKYTDNDVHNDAHIEERISTPWTFNNQPVDVYTDINLYADNNKCDNMQFAINGKQLPEFPSINEELNSQDGKLIDENGNYVSLDDAINKIEEIAVNGIYLLYVPFYKEFMINESYVSGLKGEPMITEQDYIDNLVEWGDALTDPAITMCGEITTIDQLHTACESAPDFNNGKGGRGVMIPEKLQKYLDMGREVRAKEAEDIFNSVNSGNKNEVEFGD